MSSPAARKRGMEKMIPRLWSAATAAFVRSVSNFWSVTSVPLTSETTDEIFDDGDRDGRVMMIPWPRRC
jgi:hypothetical protein